MSLWRSMLGRARCRSKTPLPPSLQHHIELHKDLDLCRPISEVDFVAFDTELTGLDFHRDSIISIGAIKLRGSRIYPAQTMYRLVRPESELKRKSVVVHELTHADLADAAGQPEVLLDFIEFIGNAVLVGHFIHIDLHFVNRALKHHFGCTLRSRAMDTATLHDWLYDNDSCFARHYHGMTTRSDLFTMAKRYGVEGGKAHNAFSDAYMTAQLFQRFAHFLPGCGVNTLRELLKIARP